MELLFIHNEWNDICILNENNSIERKNIKNEKGYYYYDNNNLVIDWTNWEGNDIFIKFKNVYIDKNLEFKTENMNNIKIIYKNISYECITINDRIFNKFLLKKYGTFSINKKILTINWNDNLVENFILSENDYYEIDFFLSKNKKNKEVTNDFNIISYDENNQIEEFDDLNEISNKDIYKIKDGYFYSLDYINNNLNKNNYYYNYNFDLNYDKDENFFYNLYKYNPKYLDIKNYKLYKNKYFLNKDNLIDKFFKFNMQDNIDLNSNKTKIVTLSEWGYPPFGGGENWLLNMSKIFYDFNYENYIICFSDGFNGKNFENNNIIDLDYVKIIQMPYNLIEIVKIIRIINPSIINHQGIKRIEFMKIANLLNIPFITGFCFWNNIINQGHNNINILENNEMQKDLSFELINKYSYTYAASDFVNDVIYKFFNKKLNVIETISLRDDYYVEQRNPYYVTLLNCHYNKGGYLIKYLLENLNKNIPLLLIYTEYDDKISLGEIKELVKNRNNLKNVNILYTEKQNVKDIYKDTKIILIPSLCDETFCRVAYEAQMNNIPVISTKSGNLKYLLKGYSIFLNNNSDFEQWKNEIEKLYSLNLIKKNDKIKKINDCENIIKNKIYELIQKTKTSKYKREKKNIGIIAPWADQGLGIQARSYYLSMENLGYNPYIFAFRPYHGNHENNYLQIDKKEWDYKNIYYSPNIRENIDYFEMLNFIHDNKIDRMIILEATFEPIFKIISLFKMLHIYTYLIVNIECVRISEINYHGLFDKILCNNYNSYFIMNNLINERCSYLGFHLDNLFFNKYIKEEKKNKHLKFVCSGGLNSISRKNIDKIFEVFYELFNNDTSITNVTLNILIQGVEIPDQLSLEHPKIIKKIKNYSYNDNLINLFNNDIYIHLGGQEGLGLGFYEALYMGIPIITLDWTPNNELIINNVNGWLINCYQDKVYENTECLINRGMIKKEVLAEKIYEIINNFDDTIEIINNTIKNRENFVLKNKNKFFKNFKKYLSTVPNFN